MDSNYPDEFDAEADAEAYEEMMRPRKAALAYEDDLAIATLSKESQAIIRARREVLKGANEDQIKIFDAARSLCSIASGIFELWNNTSEGSRPLIGSLTASYFASFRYFSELNPGLSNEKLIEKLQAISDYAERRHYPVLPIYEEIIDGEKRVVHKTAHGMHSDMLKMREAYQQTLRKAEIQKEAERL